MITEQDLTTAREKQPETTDFYRDLLIETIGRYHMVRQQLVDNDINPDGPAGIDAEDIRELVEDSYKAVEEE